MGFGIKIFHKEFLNEKELPNVDDDFVELAKEFYHIPGVATYGASCSGHFNPTWEKKGPGWFYPEPHGHLGLLILTEQEHILELLQLIHETTQNYEDARLEIRILDKLEKKVRESLRNIYENKGKNPKNFYDKDLPPELCRVLDKKVEQLNKYPKISKNEFIQDYHYAEYGRDVNLEPYKQSEFLSLPKTMILRIRLGHNHSLDPLRTYREKCYDPIKLEGNQEVFEKTKQRYGEIKNFWKTLENRVREYNQEHGFTQLDLEKKEFIVYLQPNQTMASDKNK